MGKTVKDGFKGANAHRYKQNPLEKAFAVKWQEENSGLGKPRTNETCPVYIVGQKADQEEIEKRVRYLAVDESCCYRDSRKNRPDGMGVREHVGLDNIIKFEPGYDDPCVGWLELDNGFFFTVDPIMAERFAALFGVTVEIKTAQMKDFAP